MGDLASIDKLRMTVRDFEIERPSEQLNIKHRDRKLSTPDRDETGFLLRTKYGADVYGQKIYANIPDVMSIDISQIPDGTLALKIETNPNKHHHQWEPATEPEQYLAFRRRIETSLSDIGIGCDLSSASISRLDLAKQKRLFQPLGTYHQVFAQIKAKRQQETKHGDTYRVGNGQRQTAIYDKHIESKLPPEYRNLIRLEHRFLSPRTVSRYSGLLSVSDLDREIRTSGYNGLTETYNTYLMSEILSKFDRERMVAESEREHIQQIAAAHPNKLFEIYIGNLGIDTAIAKHGSISNLAANLTDAREYANIESRNRQYRRAIAKIESQIAARHQFRRGNRSAFNNLTRLFDEIASFAA